jgi:hypothetical protein
MYRCFKVLREVVQAHDVFLRVWAEVKPYILAGHAFEFVVRPLTRSSAQNSRMWAMLADVAKQVEWHGKKLASTDWKHVFSAAITKQAVVPNLDGTGFVVLGQSTSDMTKREMSEMIELITAFGAQHDVVWSEPAQES